MTMRLPRYSSALCLLIVGSLVGCEPEPTHKKKRDGGVTIGGTGGTTPEPSPGGSGGTGGSGGSGGSPSITSDAATPSTPTEAPSKSDAGAPAAGGDTYVALFDKVFAPGCTAPNGACHSVMRSQYFIFASGKQMDSYKLLVPTPPKAGTIPQRVMTILSHVTPTKAGDPTTVRMPPQSGKNLGNPPVKLPPLNEEQIGAIKAWAMSGAKYE
jgi:hypothetical protein